MISRCPIHVSLVSADCVQCNSRFNLVIEVLLISSAMSLYEVADIAVKTRRYSCFNLVIEVLLISRLDTVSICNQVFLFIQLLKPLVSFNLVIEVLLISSLLRNLTDGSVLTTYMFQSRNRGSFDFKFNKSRNRVPSRKVLWQ